MFPNRPQNLFHLGVSSYYYSRSSRFSLLESLGTHDDLGAGQIRRPLAGILAPPAVSRFLYAAAAGRRRFSRRENAGPAFFFLLQTVFFRAARRFLPGFFSLRRKSTLPAACVLGTDEVSGDGFRAEIKTPAGGGKAASPFRDASVNLLTGGISSGGSSAVVQLDAPVLLPPTARA